MIAAAAEKVPDAHVLKLTIFYKHPTSGHPAFLLHQLIVCIFYISAGHISLRKSENKVLKVGS